jgi:hypothetical protein
MKARRGGPSTDRLDRGCCLAGTMGSDNVRQRTPIRNIYKVEVTKNPQPLPKPNPRVNSRDLAGFAESLVSKPRVCRGGGKDERLRVHRISSIKNTLWG